jgi:hypothetical protein
MSIISNDLFPMPARAPFLRERTNGPTVWQDLAQQQYDFAPLYCTGCDDYIGQANVAFFGMVPNAQAHLALGVCEVRGRNNRAMNADII